MTGIKQHTTPALMPPLVQTNKPLTKEDIRRICKNYTRMAKQDNNNIPCDRKTTTSSRKIAKKLRMINKTSPHLLRGKP